MKGDTFDYDNPQLHLIGAGLIDCRDEENYAYILDMFPNKREIIDSAKSAAIKVIGSGSTKRNPPNPHNQLFSPLRWTAWNTSYSFWTKHYRCKGGR
jgi:hypothetical protein